MFLYLFALFLLGCGGHMGHKILNGSPSEQPLNPGALLATTIVADIAWIAWFIRGFWLAWWMPLAGLVGGGILTGLIVGYIRIRHGTKAPVISMLTSLFGIGFTIGAI